MASNSDAIFLMSIRAIKVRLRSSIIKAAQNCTAHLNISF